VPLFLFIQHGHLISNNSFQYNACNLHAAAAAAEFIVCAPFYTRLCMPFPSLYTSWALDY
jgi:hypothetical protein